MPNRRNASEVLRFERRDCWREEEVFIEGDRFYENLLSALDAARHTVEIEMYIFTTDALAERFVVKLAEAARRGVSVRVLVDGVGSYGSIVSNGERLRAAGVEFRVYHPVRLTSLLKRLLALPRLSPLRRFFATINRRNHRKVCLIDMREAWLGSLNFSAVHSRALSGAPAWRDTGVRVIGTGVRDLRRAFERVWYTAAERRRWGRTRRWAARQFRSRACVRLNLKRRHRRANFRDLLDRIERAERRIWITNAYFVPHGAVLRGLTAAAARGIDVQLLVPHRSDVFFMPWIGAYFYEPLLRGGVRIFEYLPAMLHAKHLIIDDWVLAGTSNLNQRSLLHDLEVDIVLRQPGSLALLEGAFHDDRAHAAEIRPIDLAGRPWWQRLIARICFSYRRWL